MNLKIRISTIHTIAKQGTNFMTTLANSAIMTQRINFMTIVAVSTNLKITMEDNQRRNTIKVCMKQIY